MSRRGGQLLKLAAGVAAVATSGAAFADPTYVPAVTVSGGAGYSSNPFLLNRGNTDAATANIDITPTLDIVDAQTRATITANYNRQQYLNKYSANDAFGITLNGGTQIDQRTSLNLSSGFTSSILGAAGAYGFLSSPITNPSTPGSLPPTTPIDPITGAPLPVGGDVGLIGLRQRRNEVTASASLTYLPSARSTWTFGLNGVQSTYPDERIEISDYRTLGGSVSYSRSLSELQSVGLDLSATVASFDNRPDTRIYTPRLTYTRKFSELWTFNAAAGGSIVDDGDRTRTTVSVEATICRQAELGSFCLTGSREPNVNGINGVQVQTTGSLSYSRQLSELTSVNANVSYTRIGNTLSRVPSAFRVEDQGFLSTGVSVDRRISQQLSVFGALNYRDASGLGRNIKADFGGQVGVRWVLGKRQ